VEDFNTYTAIVNSLRLTRESAIIKILGGIMDDQIQKNGVETKSKPQDTPAENHQHTEDLPGFMSSNEMSRFRSFISIQIIFLVLSPLAGGFHYKFWSMLDTALLLLSIGISSLVLVLDTSNGRKLAFKIAVLLYLLGVLDMSLNILLSGVLGWRGFIPGG